MRVDKLELDRLVYLMTSESDSDEYRLRDALLDRIESDWSRIVYITSHESLPIFWLVYNGRMSRSNRCMYYLFDTDTMAAQGFSFGLDKAIAIQNHARDLLVSADVENYF
jgi:hypothetical protein